MEKILPLGSLNEKEQTLIQACIPELVINVDKVRFTFRARRCNQTANIVRREPTSLLVPNSRLGEFFSEAKVGRFRVSDVGI